jgi:type IV secretion system protein VirD4
VIAAILGAAALVAVWVSSRDADLALAAGLSSGLLLRSAQWAFLPHACVPHFRVQSIKLRLRLRLHPGRGFATVAEVLLHWNRYASFRASKRTRPSLGWRTRLLHPSEHSIFLGRVQYRLGLRLPIQEHLCIFGPPRAYKSGFLARTIANYQGAVVSTSTKGDMFSLTAGIRHHGGSPLYVFNPQRLGRARSNIRWNLVAGCAEPATAIRRAQALCEAASTEGTEEATFWSEQAAMQMRAMLCAADLMGRDFRIVNHWILTGETRSAEKTLVEAGYITWAGALRQMRSGKAERTTATIRLVLSSAVSFMSDPSLAECVIPERGDAFDFERFLLEGGSLYLIGEQRGKGSPIAPLFCGLVTEIHFAASQMGGSMKGDRLEPPLLLALDEVTQIVPIPLPSIVADSGGRGIQLIIAAHGIAQLRSRWGADGARVILDCCNLMVNPGVQDPDTLELAQRLTGKTAFKVKGSDKAEDLPIIPVEAIRQLPPKRTLLIRTWREPIVTRLPMGWRDWRYLLARLGGYAEPELASVPGLAVAAAATAAFVEDLAEAQPAMAGVPGAGEPAEEDQEPELEPVPSGAGGVAPPRFISPTSFQPPQLPGPDGHANGKGHNGNGHYNGHHGNGSGHPRAKDPWGEEL